MSPQMVGVVGLGVTGMSLVRYYRSRGYSVSVYDESPRPPLLATLRSEFPDIDCTRVEDFSELSTASSSLDLLALSPGVPLRRLPDDLELVSELDLFAKEWQRHREANPRARLITVTGTNGKSTASELIARLAAKNGRLSSEAIGNIGIPLLDAVSKWSKQGWPDCVVAELSSYQLAGAKHPLKAQLAVLLNLSEDHLDWHGSMENYLAAKTRIFAAADCGVYDSADERCKKAAAAAKRTMAFNSEGESQGKGWGVANGRLVNDEWRQGPSVKALVGAGIMPATAAAALTAITAAGLADEIGSCLSDLENMKGLPHRLERIAELGGITYVNDSKATNCAASCAALAATEGGCVPIFGGLDKGQDFTALADAALAAGVQSAVLLGSDTLAWQKALVGAGIQWQQAVTMKEAVVLATKAALAAGVGCVLLSPGGASQDRYASFVNRGDDFRSAVELLQ